MESYLKSRHQYVNMSDKISSTIYDSLIYSLYATRTSDNNL